MFFLRKRVLLLCRFFVLGDPDPDLSVRLMIAAVDAGADILELGIPFSDPIADGPTIQRADLRALGQGITCRKALDLVAQVKQQRDVPVGLLMYYNLIVHYGLEQFYRDAAQAGVNSVLIADLCVDDAQEVAQACEQNKLDTVFMVTPNTSPARRKAITEKCTGFIYTVAVLGVTGARMELGEAIVPLIESLKAETSTPVCVGFGVSKPEHARALTQAGADGVIVGSAIVNLVEQNRDDPGKCVEQISGFIREMKQACRA